MIRKIARECSLIASLLGSKIGLEGFRKPRADAEKVVFPAPQITEPHIRMVAAVQNIVRIGFQIVSLVTQKSRQRSRSELHMRDGIGRRQLHAEAEASSLLEAAKDTSDVL